MKRTTVILSIVLVALASAVHAQTSPATSFRQEGIASWYGPGFEGRATASGEIYDSAQFTAAHPTAPFGTVLTVTNTFNKRQVNVRVNDRGPFVAARIIDLSMAAAEVLDMITTGTASVIVEISADPKIGPVSGTAAGESLAAVTAAPLNAASPAGETPVIAPEDPVEAPREAPKSALIIGGIPKPGTGKHYRLQVGAFRVPRHAVDAFDKLKNAGLSPAYERLEDLYRVVLAGLTPEEIPALAEKLFSTGFAEAIIREE